MVRFAIHVVDDWDEIDSSATASPVEWPVWTSVNSGSAKTAQIESVISVGSVVPVGLTYKSGTGCKLRVEIRIRFAIGAHLRGLQNC